MDKRGVKMSYKESFVEWLNNNVPEFKMLHILNSLYFVDKIANERKNFC